jgi:serine-type D-Ala-D-Ala carboxypeptidase (penicillin-binding protein 5/6)
MSTCRHVAAALSMVVLLGGPAGAAPRPPDVACTACAIADRSGTLLWGREADMPLPNASTTKIVTALVVVENASMSEEVTVSAAAAATSDGYLALEAGDVLPVKDLLHGLLMASSNDAAVALAEHVAGSEEAFVDQMNEIVAELGGEGTHFETPHGLDVPGHVSTAGDLAAFGAELLDDPRLARIVATTDYTLSDGEAITNSNPLLESYNGANGIKTGMTAAAGEVLVASARRSGPTAIAVALGSPDASADAAALLDRGLALVGRVAPAPVAGRFATGVMRSARGLAGRVVVA